MRLSRERALGYAFVMRSLPLSVRLPVLLALLPLTVCLTACGTFGGKPKSAADLACPRVETPAQLSTITRGSGDSGNPLQLEISANLRTRDTQCDVGDKVKVATKVDLTATKGPALKEDKVQVPFFAAVIGADGTLLAKKAYETTFEFGRNITDREQVAIDFTMTKAQAASSRIYVGYQLNRAAWDAADTTSAAH